MECNCQKDYSAESQGQCRDRMTLRTPGWLYSRRWDEITIEESQVTLEKVETMVFLAIALNISRRNQNLLLKSSRLWRAPEKSICDILGRNCSFDGTPMGRIDNYAKVCVYLL